MLVARGLRAGMMGCHNSAVMELRYRVSSSDDGEVWMVRLLFVNPLDRLETFRPSDTFTPIHGGNNGPFD